MTGGTISADSVNVQAGGLRDVAQVFSDDGTTVANITKTSAGTVTFEGVNAYTGNTTVNAGTLLVAGSLTGSIVNVTAGTLGGIGSITNSVTIGDGALDGLNLRDAILSPGASIGTLSAGDVIFDDDGVFKLEINSGTAQTDRLSSTGTVVLGGIVALDPSDLGSLALGPATTFTFITAPGGVLGFFEGLPDGTEIAVGVNTYTIEYGANDVSLVTVPEPGTAVMLLGGIGSLLSLRRVRRRSSRA
jgi:autotransporter-associated beta strand protein